jgi:serine phosphatase RsbU (regulator of sigma subunit)
MTNSRESYTAGADDIGPPPVTPEEGIWRLATALSAAVTPLDVAIALAADGATVAGASFSNMAVLEQRTGRIHAVHGPGLDPVVVARWSEFDLSTPNPLSGAMVTGLPVLLPTADDLMKRYPEIAPDTLAASLIATACLPLVTRGGMILGAAGFGWPTAQEFGVDQLRRLDLVANLASQALERAELAQREQEEASSRERADAQLMQQAFLPRELPHSASLEVAAVYLPASDAAMGGDWYDVFPVDGGTCLVIGDVAGHGLQSAAVMGQLRNTVRAYAIDDPSPAQVLTRLNRLMCRLEPGQHASAIVAVWDERKGTLLRANAGHPPVLRCRTGEFGYLGPSPASRLLGVTPDWEYQEEIKFLRPGTTMLFYTDGLIEWRNPGDDDGMDGLLDFVSGLTDFTPQAACDQVIAWRLQKARQEDDVCVLAARLR